MRIDLVAPYYRPVTGGIEDHVASLADAAAEAGHTVTVHALDEDLEGNPLPPEEHLGAVQVRRWPARVQLGYYTTRFEPRLTGDLAHLHGYGLWTHDWVARNYEERPVMITLHHGLRIPPATPVHALYHWLHRKTLGKRTLRRMRRVVAVTPVDVERLDEMGFPMDRVELIPNGVPDAAFAASRPYPTPAGWETYFVYVGRLHEEKSVGDAVEALSDVPASAGLFIAGPDHGERKRLEALVAQRNVSDRVRFMGRVPGDQKRALLAGARALVLPSKYEAQGRVILEAWAQGTPAVASRVGGVPHVVDHGRDGLLYEWGDVGALAAHLARLVGAPPVARAMGQAGLAKAKASYREPELVARTLALYEQVVEEHRRQGPLQ